MHLLKVAQESRSPESLRCHAGRQQHTYLLCRHEEIIESCGMTEESKKHCRICMFIPEIRWRECSPTD